MDKHSFLVGLSLGLAGKPLPLAESKEPIAYLYNGVQLPDINKVMLDKNLPACITLNLGSGNYHLWFGAIGTRYPEYAAASATWDYIQFYDLAQGNKATHYRLFPDASEWTYFAESAGIILSGSSSGHAMIWSNYDILNEDGSLYFAASDPIPVYE